VHGCAAGCCYTWTDRHGDRDSLRDTSHIDPNAGPRDADEHPGADGYDCTRDVHADSDRRADAVHG